MRHEDERVFEGAGRVVEIVAAEFLVAGHVDGEDQGCQPVGPPLREGLDDGAGDTHLGEVLHALEGLLGEAVVAGRDLELGGAGDAVNGVLKAPRGRSGCRAAWRPGGRHPGSGWQW